MQGRLAAQGADTLVGLTALLLFSACATSHPKLESSMDGAPSERLRIGDSVQSELAETSRRNLKDHSALELFEIPAKGGTAVEIRTYSEEIDTALTLYAPDGRLLAARDPHAAGAPGSRLQTLLPYSGTYLLVVSGSDAEQLGAYGLKLDELDYTESGPLGIPSKIRGLLHSGDEAMIVRNTFVDRFILEIDERRVVVAEMISENVDAYLFITDSRGGVILGENDDAHPGTTDARLVMELQPGTYQLLATTYHPRSQGIYDLGVRALDLVDGGEIAVPGEMTGRLRGVDSIRPPRGTHYHSYDLKIETRKTVIIDMMSTDVDAYLYLLEADGETVIDENDDRPGGGTDARIVRELEPGSYQVVATTHRPEDTGIYDLRTRTVNLEDSSDLGVPSTTYWYLGGRQSQPRGRRGTLQDRHVLEVSEPADVRIDMRSDCFDAYLILLAGDGTTVLAENDDADRHTTDARLLVRLAPGRYQVAATSFRPGEEGLYELAVEEVGSSTQGIMDVGPP